MMLYVMLGTIRPHLSKEQRLAGYSRRAEWNYPEGMKVVGEWWRGSAPHVLSVVECASYDPILAVTSTWGDFMEIEFAPCTTPEAGLAAAKKLLK